MYSLSSVFWNSEFMSVWKLYHCVTNQPIQVLDHDLVFRAGISKDPSDFGLSEAKVSSNTLKCFVFSQQTCDWSCVGILGQVCPSSSTFCLKIAFGFAPQHIYACLRTTNS